MPAVQYLLESAFCLACLYAFYWLALRRQTFFQWNRAYLLLAPVFALLTPALTIRLDKPVQPGVDAAPADWPVLVEQIQSAPRAVQFALEQPLWTLSLGELLWWAYLTITTVLGLLLLIRAVLLIRFIRRCRFHRQQGLTLATGPAGTPLASFFGFVFWHPPAVTAAEQDLMLQHELVHVRQWHSLDLLWIEALIVLQWFNPLLYAYRRSLRAVHEYIADDQVVRHTRQRYHYARLLVKSQHAPNTSLTLVNTFHSLIKNRLTMLAKQPSHPLNRFRYLSALLLCLGLLGLFSFRLVENVPVFAPLHTAFETAEQYAGELREVTVLAEKSQNPERTPYIFYWGLHSCPIEHDPASGQYSGILELKPAEFRQSVSREPRMWNGQTMETIVSFELNQLPVHSDFNRPEVYGVSRKSLSDFAYTIQPGDKIRLTRLLLPNGRDATVTLAFDTTPAGFGPDAPTEIVWSEPGNNTMSGFLIEGGIGKNSVPEPGNKTRSGNGWGYFTWGNYLHTNLNDRGFYTAGEFWDMIESAPQHYQDNGEPSPITRCPIVLLPLRNGDAVEINITNDRNNPATYAEEKKRLRELLKNELRPDVLIYVDVDIPGFTPISGGVIRIVEDNSPALELRRRDMHKFTFEWGAFARAEPQKYGRAFPNQYGELVSIDKGSLKSTQLPLDEIKQLLDLTPHLWEDDLLLKDLSFRVQYKNLSTEYQGNGGLPADFKRNVRENLRIGDTLSLSHFIASGRYLTRHTLEIIAGKNDPKPVRSVRNESNTLQTVRLSVTPNPAHEQATVDISLPKAGPGLFTVTDAMGAVRYSLQTDFHLGITPFKLPLAQINAKGVLYLRLDMPYGSGQAVMVVE